MAGRGTRLLRSPPVVGANTDMLFFLSSAWLFIGRLTVYTAPTKPSLSGETAMRSVSSSLPHFRSDTA
jgi:hypothetical protein